MKLSEQQPSAEELKEFAQIRANMKAFLKQQSKNDLIKMIFEQLDLYIELRQELKALKAQKEEVKND